MSIFNSILRKSLNEHNKKRLINKDFSLICNNCNGAFICHDLGIKYNSPFVNLWIKPNDYIRFLKNLRYYLNLELVFIEEEMIDYPVGLLGDIKIYFQHYSSCDEAYIKWKSRVARINYENLFILFIERDGCTINELSEFDSLPFANKIVFTHKKYGNIKSSFYIPGYEQVGYVGNCYEFINVFSKKKYYDYFDYVGWFNCNRKIK